MTQGRSFFVNPGKDSDGNALGSDGNTGTRPDRPLATLAEALSLATAGQNDVIYMFAASNTAGSTTDYQSATLNWNKDMVHLIGVNASPFIGQRSRVAFLSTYNTASNLFTLSASGCLIANIEFYAGVVGTNPTGCMVITGQRNHLVKCQISGIGNTYNDIAGAYSLKFDGAAENLLEDCYIGLDTVTRSAQINAEIYAVNAAVRNMLVNCQIATYAGHQTNPAFLRIGVAGIDRWLKFKNCLFFNPINSAATILTQACVINAAPGGTVILENSSLYGAIDWNSTDTGNVVITQGAPAASTSGLSVAVTR